MRQNWGFETIKTTSLPYINAVLWEGFHKGIVLTDEWSPNWITYFQSQSTTLQTLTVTNTDHSFSYSNPLGFLATHNEDDIYDE
ncbi:hypothetical protein [Priestia endophytica]|uniref:hypothetical protein n=1 Tax=Priestia endophytica TaxID=135735 RepID=UPI0022813985|nr:hypothetical protein [Priestia endophytica]MCY8234627.1 hypothetical protein [Priestia endophytica]